MSRQVGTDERRTDDSTTTPSLRLGRLGTFLGGIASFVEIGDRYLDAYPWRRECFRADQDGHAPVGVALPTLEQCHCYLVFFNDHVVSERLHGQVLADLHDAIVFDRTSADHFESGE